MQRLATFFDVDVIACRPYKPKDKGMAEDTEKEESLCDNGNAEYPRRR